MALSFYLNNFYCANEVFQKSWGVRVFVTCTQVRKLWLGGHEFPTKMKIQGGKGPIVDCPWGEEGVQKSVCIKTYLPPPPRQKKN